MMDRRGGFIRLMVCVRRLLMLGAGTLRVRFVWVRMNGLFGLTCVRRTTVAGAL